ncbi:MAG: hypothetical protein EXR72_04435 [Myxococcales bacterium]|nr:hypothetical protein [Myxococcales bacterium]
MTNPLRGLLAFTLLAFSTLGCKQAVGDRCQINSDCQEGLSCIIPAGGSIAEGGSCRSMVGGGQPDLSMAGEDAAPADMATAPSDLAVAPDLAMPDQAMPTDAAADLKPAADLAPPDSKPNG